MQPNNPWNAYPPPPPPSRAPWVVIIVVVLLVVLMLGAMMAGALFFFVRRSASASAPVVYSPPAIATPAVVPPVVPLPTATTTATAPTASATKVYLVPIGSSPVLGKSDAIVTLVEFGDFQCPFCKRLAPTIDKLRVEYGADLRVVWKNNPLPFHVNAAPAAELALEARTERGDATFWKVHDDLYTAAALDQASLLLIARANGVSETRARTAMTSNTYQTLIDADQSLARHVDATGTPTSFVNGRIVIGAQSIEKFETTIEAALKDARARVAGGTPRSRIYDEIMREAAAAP